MPRETYEYAYLTLVNSTSVKKPGVREWVGIVQADAGTTVHGTGDSALKLINQLGQSGWMISDAYPERVQDNRIPGWLMSVLVSTFGGPGVVHFTQTRFMTRHLEGSD